MCNNMRNKQILDADMDVSDRMVWDGDYDNQIGWFIDHDTHKQDIADYGTAEPQKTVVQKVTDPIGRYVVPGVAVAGLGTAASAAMAEVGVAGLAALIAKIAMGAIYDYAVDGTVCLASDRKYGGVGDALHKKFGINDAVGELANPGSSTGLKMYNPIEYIRYRLMRPQGNHNTTSRTPDASSENAPDYDITKPVNTVESGTDSPADRRLKTPLAT